MAPLPPSATSRTTPSSASFDLTSTPLVGRMATSTAGSRASARAITTFCWLPPESPDTGCPGPVVLMSSDAIMRRANSRVRDGSTVPIGPSWSATVRVAFSATLRPGTSPSRCRSSGT